MREASVGFQCPSCVVAGAKGQRQPTTVFGGQISANPRSVTSILIAINAVAFVARVATGGFGGPVNQAGSMWAGSVMQGEYWRMLTSSFLHSGLMHIAFNMFALYFLGPVIEAALGRAKYLITYITLAVSSSVWVYWLSPVNTSSVGASGVVFGLLGMVLVFMLRSKQDVTGLLILLAINAVLSLRENISWQAHLGGFVMGLILAAVFVWAPREHRQRVHVLAFSAVWLFIVVATAARTAHLWNLYG